MICEIIQKYTKIQASMQHGLYLFTCEISSVNSSDSSETSPHSVSNSDTGMKPAMYPVTTRLACSMPRATGSAGILAAR